MTDYNPVADGGSFTYTTSAAVTGGQVVENTGNGTIGPAGLTSLKVVGVVAVDAPSGAQVNVYSPRKIHSTVTGTGGLTAGQPVKAGAAGTIVLWVTGTDAPGAQIGVCTVGATVGNAAQWVGI